jgi:hypothetical protein
MSASLQCNGLIAQLGVSVAIDVLIAGTGHRLKGQNNETQLQKIK